MRYVRRLAAVAGPLRACAAATRGVSTIAFEAGYGTEAAFNRAFARAFGCHPPPGARRHGAPMLQAEPSVQAEQRLGVVPLPGVMMSALATFTGMQLAIEVVAPEIEELWRIGERGARS